LAKVLVSKFAGQYVAKNVRKYKCIQPTESEKFGDPIQLLDNLFLQLANSVFHYTGWSKKQAANFSPYLAKVDRFSNFFHRHILQKICNKMVTKYTNTP